MIHVSTVMQATPPNAEVRSHGGGRFSLVGIIDFDNAGQIMADGHRLFLGHNNIVVETSSAEVSSTAGLAVMMEWASWCDDRDVVLAYEGFHSSALAVAELNGVAPMLPIAVTPK